ncbi:MAG: DUF2817 domain-containing protein [Phycisphaerae bacterium]|nr:DUF2817 domain-containing protein [Phycisphaerae bacterium]
MGHSVEGRAIQARVIGPTKPLADVGARRCLIIAGIHGDEPEGLSAVDEVASVARSHAARWMTAIIRDLNPDGTAHRTRRNAQGVDLNRNWPASNFRSHRSHGAQPLSEPESMVGNRLIEVVQPELIVVFHSSSSGPFVTFDGPARSLAQVFADAASTANRPWRVRASMGYPTPGSLGSLLGVDRHLAILTIEFRRGQSEGVAEAVRRGLNAVLATEAVGLKEHLDELQGSDESRNVTPVDALDTE